MLISIVVCTRNRASQLQRALDHLRALDYSGEWEVVLVNNNSSDNTAEVLEQFESSVTNACVVHEPRRGLASARNAGLMVARGDVIAFTDDDCYPQSDFLRCIEALFSEPGVHYAGGQVLLHDPRDRPITIQESSQFRRISDGEIVADGFILGANMVARASALYAVNGFDERLGAGCYFSSGEDTDLLRRMSLAGYVGVYDPRIVVSHHHGRQRRMDEIQLLRSYDRGAGAAFAKLVRHDVRLARTFYWQLRSSSFQRSVRRVWFFFLFLLIHGVKDVGIEGHPSCLPEPQ